MEIRLIKIIALPAMILTFFSGTFLIYINYNILYENYFILKFFFVFILILYQIYLITVYTKFKVRDNIRSGKFYKFINEIPTILMIIIILLVVLKPNLG